MNVDGAYSHVGVEGIFVEQYSAASTVGDVVMVREGIVLRVLDCGNAKMCLSPAAQNADPQRTFEGLAKHGCRITFVLHV